MGSTLTVDNIQGATTAGTVKMPAGHIIQTVMATTQTTTESGANGYVDTGFSATITPQFNTSKVLVIHSAGGIFKNHDTDGNNTVWHGMNSLQNEQPRELLTYLNINYLFSNLSFSV